ncbi:MAG TPA: hypothetical protein HPQ00_07860, partial [Magnetococcales bacterium]|nr:hypothetical protein [Magnetococcales bacterium]
MASTKESKPKAVKSAKKAGSGSAQKKAPLEKIELQESLEPQSPEAKDVLPDQLPSDGVAVPSMEEVLNSLESMLDGEESEEDTSGLFPDGLNPRTIKLDDVVKPKGAAAAVSVEDEEVLDLTGMEIDFPTPVDVAAVTKSLAGELDSSSLEGEFGEEEGDSSLVHGGDEESPLLEEVDEEGSLALLEDGIDEEGELPSVAATGQEEDEASFIPEPDDTENIVPPEDAMDEEKVASLDAGKGGEEKSLLDGGEEEEASLLEEGEEEEGSLLEEGEEEEASLLE